jgi:futalosine hydrolase
VILVLCALPEELRYFQADDGVRVVATGVGPVEAAIVATRELRGDTRYAAVVNAGIAGAFRSNGATHPSAPQLRVGDAVLVTAESLADFGLEGDGPLTLPGGATLADRVDADAALVERCTVTGLPRAAGLTVAEVTATDATADRLQRRYGAATESMEGFAVLRAAALAGVPAVEVRGISNYVGDRATSAWDFAAGARATALALEAVLATLRPSSPSP